MDKKNTHNDNLKVVQTMNFYAPIGQQIAHVDKIEAHFDKDMGMQVAVAEEVCTEQKPSNDGVDDLCHFIHPTVNNEDERLRIHKEIQNLVRCNNFLNICAYLKSMADERRILLPIDPSSAFAELHRMGMPGEENDGFSYKNFCKYYKK